MLLQLLGCVSIGFVLFLTVSYGIIKFDGIPKKEQKELPNIGYEFKIKFIDGTEILRWGWSTMGVNMAADSLTRTLFEVEQNQWYTFNSMLKIEFTGKTIKGF